MELCILCSKDIGVGEVVTLRQKGADSINKASKERVDDLHVEAKSGCVIHKSCILEYTNAKSIEFCQKRKEEAAIKQSDRSATFRQYI